MENEIFLKLLSELGFPILVSLVSIYAVFLTLKLILADVLVLIKKILDVIAAIQSKSKDMEGDIAILGILISGALGVKLDLTQFTNKMNQDKYER